MTAFAGEELAGASALKGAAASKGSGAAKKAAGGKSAHGNKAAVGKAPAQTKTASTSKTSSKSTTSHKYFDNAKSQTATKTPDKASSSAPSFEMPKLARASHRKLLTAEYIVGAAAIFLSPLGSDGTVSNAGSDYQEAVEQFVAWTLAFFILALLSNAGENGGNISAGIGGLMTLVLLLRPKNAGLFNKLTPPGFRKPGTFGSGVGAAIAQAGLQPVPPPPTVSGSGGIPNSSGTTFA